MITARQLEVLRAIRDYHAARGFPISLRELGEQFSFGRTRAFQHVKRLRQFGLVTKEKRRGRTLLITTAGQRALP